jgi:hypothetical protein
MSNPSEEMTAILTTSSKYISKSEVKYGKIQYKEVKCNEI